LLALFIWLRGTLPRLRQDQLMAFAWKWLLPMTLANMVVAGVWKYSAPWSIPGSLLVRWALCAILIAIPYVLLGRALQPQVQPRTYRYADA
jgi:NADH-quinone oxidoreductase subunit H